MSLSLGAVAKKVLKNGLTVLVSPDRTTPKVSMEIHYHVGSKDEKTGEKGMAHLIEHMIFKGTELLSESDINVITHQLSGYTNAFTSHDMTGYIYDFPTQHWQEGFRLLSDCMRNARFDDQMLSSELKAVIQELKLYKDRYAGQLIDELISAIFIDHPYHYPIIGFKQDLWSLKRQTLVDFYKKHYVPNNAVLIVAGDVDTQDVFAQAEKWFESIPADPHYKREEFYHGKDLVSKTVTLYRDVQQPIVIMTAIFPGAKAKKQYVFDVLNWILGHGDNSRLRRKLVDELELVTELDTFCYDLEDATPFFIYFEPKEIDDVQKIMNIIHEEIAKLVKDGFTQKELVRATKQVKTSVLNTLESNRKRASLIGEAFFYTGDENFIAKYLTDGGGVEDIEKEIKEVLSFYASPSMIHWGQVVPLPEAGKKQWVLLQEISDAEDTRILAGRTRTTAIEQAKSAKDFIVRAPQTFHFHRPEKMTLSNGVHVFAHSNTALPKIDIVVTFKARPEYDSEELPGLYAFVCDMLTEGTKNYPGTSITDIFEEYGMNFSIEPGVLKLGMLSEDLAKGLELVHELLTNAVFEKQAIEKIRDKMLTDLNFFWDEPHSFAGQLVVETIYRNHPYSKNLYGTEGGIKGITQKDLKKFYTDFFSPDGARIALVGDLHDYNSKEVLEKTIGKWQGAKVADLVYPAVSAITPEEILHPINRDQVVLTFARPSLKRTDPEYDKLALFEQIFAGGSMNSYLFRLREQSGLFYTISGSMAAHADEQPGICCVQTIVSLDRLDEAEKAIKKTIDESVDLLTEQELEDAKQVIINAQVDNFSSNRRMASAFLFVDKYKHSETYFDTRADVINKITLQEVKETARKFLKSNTMMTLKIGRVK